MSTMSSDPLNAIRRTFTHAGMMLLAVNFTAPGSRVDEISEILNATEGQVLSIVGSLPYSGPANPGLSEEEYARLYLLTYANPRSSNAAAAMKIAAYLTRAGWELDTSGIPTVRHSDGRSVML